MSDTSLALPQSKLFIGGEWTTAARSHTFETINPATEAVITSLALASRDDVNAAVAAARTAFDNGPWPRTPAADRAKVLRAIADGVRKHKDELAALETADTGKTLFDSAKIEIPLVAEIFDYYAGWCDKLVGETIPIRYNALAMTLREPIGVIGLITPWNFPLLLATWKIAPALAAGNTCVHKPAQITSLTALKLAEIVQAAGLPPGAYNVVTGKGSEAGNAIVTHPGVDKIAFTGSTEVGKQVMKQAADTVKKISLELGGKSPNVIFADADLQAAVRGALTGIFYNKGEVCAAGSRIFVEQSVYDEVSKAIAEKAGGLTLGDPRDKGTRMGPVVSAEQLRTVMGYIEAGKKEGAKLLAGGTRADIGGKGFFVQPTVFGDVRNDMTIAREEIFGPVASIIPFKDFDDVIRQANDTFYGLAAGIWTKDIKKGLRAAKAIKAGTVWVNTYNMYDPALPFGGFKQSGFGRELGAVALDGYTEIKSVWVDLT